ncbi:MAG: sigma-70 family RNA polymerase sigma factor [Dehalococcoidia bacterium]|nr:sigma-70 family RNA polymerase sigma factor [Dehalococcoidia bacterium]
MSEEQDLVTRAVQGDADAFAELYESNFDRVYRYLYVRLGNQAEAEDLTQEVFSKMLEAIGTFQWRNVPFASWLFRIAHNKMIDYIRREKRVERVDSDEAVLSLDDSDPADVAEHNLQLEKVRHNIGRLSPAQREVIWLRFGAGLSTTEVASALGKSTGTVKALQYNGIVALRKRMEQPL